MDIMDAMDESFPWASSIPSISSTLSTPSTLKRGWLFDLYPREDRIVLWIICDDGERLRLATPFSPSFYVANLRRAGLTQRTLAGWIERQTPGFTVAGVISKTDFWTGRPRRVLEIRVTDLDAWAPNLRKLFRRWPDLEFFNCDILPEIVFGYQTRLFPTCRIEFSYVGEELERLSTISPGSARGAQAGGPHHNFAELTLTHARALDDSLTTEYEPPPLRQAELGAVGELTGRAPRLRAITYAMNGESITWDGDPADMIESLNARLRRDDPDLIWTRGGDSAFIPALLRLSEATRVPLALDREPGVRRAIETDGKTYVSYGRVLYHAPDYPFFGRWHIDRENSFWAAETGLAGLIETARLSRIPLQRAARRSIGTGISAVQLDLAWRDGFLIPWKKARPEDWKSAATLLKSDRGGLVYQPLTGVYEDVIELDFVSMYPSIMVRRNVSPETVNCACCEPNHAVPELGYTICEKRRGLIPRALEPIIEKRNEYKRLRALAKKRMTENVGRLSRADKADVKDLPKSLKASPDENRARASARCGVRRLDAAFTPGGLTPGPTSPTSAFAYRARLKRSKFPDQGGPSSRAEKSGVKPPHSKSRALRALSRDEPVRLSRPASSWSFAGCANPVGVGRLSRADKMNVNPVGSREPTYSEANLSAKANVEPAELHTRYDGRQGAIKWMLVTCFGYLGYRNARFGRIEAHETTCAWSRELLLRAREICEDRGFRVLHAIVDCVWLTKPGATPNEITELCREIDAATDLTIAIEGRYRWLAFLPSRQDPLTPVPNRYFGVFEDGSLKFRGIELRRSDQPPCARAIQRALLDRMAALGGLPAIRAARAELVEMVRQAESRLRRHEEPVEACVMTRKTSRTAEEYKNNHPTAVAARQARRAGIPLHAGQALTYVVTRAGDIDPDSRVKLTPLLQPEETYDGDFYAAQVRSAAATLLDPILGETWPAPLDKEFNRPTKLRKSPRRKPAPPPQFAINAEQLDLFGR